MVINKIGVTNITSTTRKMHVIIQTILSNTGNVELVVNEFNLVSLFCVQPNVSRGHEKRPLFECVI